MSLDKFETVSSILDSQQVKEEDVKALCTNEEMSDAWQRYHLMGDILRGEASSDLNVDISNNVAQLLAEEPTVLAPRTFGQKVKAKVVYLAKPAGQFAIAASAALFMILGVQQSNQSDDIPAVQNQVFQPMPIGGIADPVSYNFSQPVRPNQQAEQKAFMEQQKRMNALLNDHRQQLKMQQSEDHESEQQK